MSEELEHSLQQAIETYLNQRLHDIEEQLSQLQTEFNQALGRVRESAEYHSLSETPLSASIFAHFQAARAQKLSGVTAPSSEPGASLIATLKRAVDQIEKQKSHSEVLNALLTNAAGFAERVALFVVRNEQAIGWRLCESSDPANVEALRGVALPLSADTLVSQAARARSSWSGVPESHSGNGVLIDQLGGKPQSVAAIPLIAREKVVAVLYADSTLSDPDAIGLDAIEVLARVAAMSVELASAGRTQPAQETEREAISQPAPTVAEVEAGGPVEVEAIEPAIEAKAEPEPEPEPVYTPHVEPQAEAPQVFVEPVIEAIAQPTTPEPVAEEPVEPVVEAMPAETTPEVVSEAPQSEPGPAITVAPEILTPAPSSTSPYVAPLGSTRRYGVTEPELSLEVGEEERRLHNDARRFARLLVSEIKLYNEMKVKEGRSQGNLYDRLREDIDRSRQMYDKRVAPPVAARHDYFHQELVNTLAEGDPAKLGANYPGAAVVMV